MDADKQAQLQAHARAIAALLYDETAPEHLTTLEGIEVAVRGHLLEQISPQIGLFLSKQRVAPAVGEVGTSKASSAKSALRKPKKALNVKAHTHLSPYLEKCCLLVSANASYERSAQDLTVLTGMNVSRGAQQRLVHRQIFEVPAVETAVEEMSLDGGKVRIRTPLGEGCRWQDYKAVSLHGQCQEAFLQENERLVDWVNAQPLATPLLCIGDGHDGIWNLFDEIASTAQRQEILDWFHLIENLHKVGGSERALATVEACLWVGNVEAAIEQFQHWRHERVHLFIAYLTKHRHRIVNYSYFQAEGMSIGSGSVESTVKRIGARIKLSGAQWKAENVPQVLLQRCAYLNGQFST